MVLHTPPSITPRQMNLLRIVVAMAWSDGHLASEEVELMVSRFSALFANEPEQQQQLQQELRDYLIQNLPLEQLIAKLETPEEKALVLRLGREVIGASSRTPDEPKVNAEESAAYEKLVQLLQLPAETVQQIEADTAAASGEGVVDHVVDQLKQFLQG